MDIPVGDLGPIFSRRSLGALVEKTFFNLFNLWVGDPFESVDIEDMIVKALDFSVRLGRRIKLRLVFSAILRCVVLRSRYSNNGALILRSARCVVNLVAKDDNAAQCYVLSQSSRLFLVKLSRCT